MTLLLLFRALAFICTLHEELITLRISASYLMKLMAYEHAFEVVVKNGFVCKFASAVFVFLVELSFVMVSSSGSQIMKCLCCSYPCLCSFINKNQLNINKATREYIEKDDEKKTSKEKVKEAEAEGRDGMVSLAENENDPSRTVPNVIRETGDGGQKSIQVNRKRCWNVTEENYDVDKDAMWKIHSMIEERMKSKLPGPPTSPAQISAGKSGDEDTKKRRQRSSAVKERKCRRVCEKEEELEEGEFSKAEMEAMGLQHWKDREVAAAVKSSLQIDVASSMHVSMEPGSTVEDERKSQHRASESIFGFSIYNIFSILWLC